MWGSLWRVSNTLFNQLKQRGSRVLNHHLPRWTISCTRFFNFLCKGADLPCGRRWSWGGVFCVTEEIQDAARCPNIDSLSRDFWGAKSQILEDCWQIRTNSGRLHLFPGLISGTKIALWWLSFLTVDESFLLMLSGLMSVCRIPTFLGNPKPAKAAAVTTWIYFGLLQGV